MNNPLINTNIKPINTKKNLVWISFLLVSFSGLLSGLPASAGAASFGLSPDSDSYNIGETFFVNVLIDTEDAAINAAQTIIDFPANILKATEVSKRNSIFTLWTQEPVYSNSKGEVSFGGGLPNPGFTGSNGKVITISFQGKSAGEAKVNFKEEAILANDAWGTNVFSSSRGGTYFIGVPEVLPPVAPPKKAPAGPAVSSPSHPFSDKWYSHNEPKFQWILPSDIIGVSTAFNQKAVSDPGDISEGLFDSKTFEKTADGVWYFHIKFKNQFGWGEITHFKVQIDTQPPQPFEITVDNEGDMTNPRPLLYFKAEDETSGISHYEIKIGIGDVFSVVEVQTNPYRLPHQAPGIHGLEIKAVDKAGNKTGLASEFKIESIPAPKITICQDIFVSGEEALYIGGSALAETKVLIFFKKNEELIKKWEVKSDKEGNWFLREEGLFKSGIYKISAKAEDSRGAISNSSEECVVRVVLKGIAVGPWIIGYEFITLLAILLFLILFVIFICLLLKIRRTKRTIERETKDLKKKFYKEYRELQEDIKIQLKILEEAKPILTEEEKEMEKQLLKDLADVERVLREELKDIEEIK